MRTADLESIQQLLHKMRKLDLFLIDHVAPELLEELNGTNERDFFGRQVHKIFLKTAKTINNTWQLELDLSDKEEVEGILDIVLAALTKKLKDQPPQTSTDALRCIEDIIHLESLLLRSLADDIQKNIRAEQNAEFYESLIKPFAAIWTFISDTLSSLVTNLVLFVQTLVGVEFQNIQQSTHLPCVHKSITRALNLLDERNPPPTDKETQKTLEKQTTKEIEKHIKAMNLSVDQKNYAFNTLFRAQNDRAPAPHSGRTIMDTLVTLWVAAKDSAAYEFQDSAELLNSRKDLIIKHLALADREYNMNDAGIDLGGKSRPACLSGIVNKIVEALEMIHPDIRIIRSHLVLADFCQELFAAEFAKLSDEEQIVIFTEKEEEEHEYNAIMERIAAAVEIELNKINTEIFNGDISAKVIRDYLANLIYLVVPETEAVLHYKEGGTNNTAKQQSTSSTDTEPKIIVADHQVTSEEITAFNNKFAQMKGLMKNSSDIQIAKHAVRGSFKAELLEKEDMLQLLAEAMLKQREELLAPKDAEEISIEADEDNQYEEYSIKSMM
ncbi:hypothetical protein [uncultured Legionella sp.]|uniref:hypothetical protein n=1 Tax=uncultured Legionella sp. TaxID=210934 RepID=UPI00260BDE7D|nr:hypothetical protein [uncultured Legionella sp.]